jgi:O-antigen ligase
MLLPLVLISVAATGITFMRPDFWLWARWLLLAGLAGQVLMAGRGLGTVNGPVAMVGILYVFWCGTTTVWSDVPELSFSKAAALALTAFATLWGGYQWVMRQPTQPSLGLFGPYVVLAGVAALGTSSQIFRAENIELYAGGTVNPNFLGLLMATSTPFLMWQIYRRWNIISQRALLGFAMVLFTAALYATVSRSSYVIFASVVTGFLFAHRIRRPTLALLIVAWLALLVSAIAPEAGDTWIRRNIYKQSDADRGVFFKREIVWHDSYEAAKVGGWFGAGYGVSVGSDEAELDSAVSTVGYGREKGSSHLAIIEEIGLVGLGLYAALMFVLFRALRAGYKASNGEARIVLGLLIGTLFGLQLQSILEAWWLSPGSPEFVLFWVTAGAGLALARLVRLGKRQRPLQAPHPFALSRV